MNQPDEFKFRLYVAGDTANSAQALANLTAFCETMLVGRHCIDVVDVLQEPTRALSDGIFMTPTLIKLSPAPVRKIVGTLKLRETLSEALGLEDVAV